MDSKDQENDTDNEPLTKPKKERTEKQKEAFERARLARAQYLEEKKKQTETGPSLKERKQALNSVKKELEGKQEKPAESDEEIILPKDKPKPKEPEIIPTKKGHKIITKKPELEPESETEVEEEIIYIKSAPKKKKKKLVKKIIFENSDNEETDDDGGSQAPPAPPTATYRQTKTQQNAKTKAPQQPAGISVAKPQFQYYFAD